MRGPSTYAQACPEPWPLVRGPRGARNHGPRNQGRLSSTTGPRAVDFALDFPGEAALVHTIYLNNDALDALLQAAWYLQSGSSSAVAFFPGELGGIWLFFSSADPSGTAHLQVIDFPDMRSEGVGLPYGAVRWSGRIDLGHFLRQVVSIADAVLDECGGPEAYERLRNGVPFPSDTLERLRRGPSSRLPARTPAR